MTPADMRSVLEALRAEPDPALRAEILRGLPAEQRELLAQRLVKRLPPEKQRAIRDATKQLAETWRPQTDDELHEAIIDLFGLRIPRTHVCKGHCAPFKLVRDVYFEEGLTDKIAIGNRGSGKTEDMAVIHGINSRTKPRHQGATVGSVLSQSERCFGYLRGFVNVWGDLVKTLQMKKTEFTNGATVEVLTGTVTGVNSPHPNLAHFDEVELFRPGVYDEALNMAQTSNGYPAMNVLTSSWKKPKGFVTKILKEVADALTDGVEPPYQVYRWCAWDVAEPCDADCSACPFSNVVKGMWPDGSPRTFESACKMDSPGLLDGTGHGKLKYADGFMAVNDLVSRFRKLGRRVWESQQESKRPSLEGLVYDNWDEDRHAVRNWWPDPTYGEIDVHADFGSVHAVGFWQTLDHDVEFDGRRIRQGTSIMFDELYIIDKGSVTAAKLVNERIIAWEKAIPGFRAAVNRIYRDVAAKTNAKDWTNLDSFGTPGDPLYAPLKTTARGGIDVETSITLVHELIDEDLLRIDVARCEEAVNEIEGYEYNEATGQPVKEDDHHMDGMRYRFWNRHVEKRLIRRGQLGATAQPRGRAVTHTQDGLAWEPRGSRIVGPLGRPSAPAVIMPRKRSLIGDTLPRLGAGL